MIKKTSLENLTILFRHIKIMWLCKGPRVEQFAPKSADKPDFYQVTEFDSVISLKAETHNFPTTVEPFNGANRFRWRNSRSFSRWVQGCSWQERQFT
jgi:phosphoribosylformylglycinamidine synthase